MPLTAPGAGPYYRTVQGAVDAARPGDWILIYPGVYHEKSAQWPTAGVWIDKPDLHIRGLDRNRVIIDGSNGTAAHPCPSAAAEQDFTPRDGIVVFKASRVTIQNLTVCDYLSGPSGHGNQIWWDGGDGSGTIGIGSFSGSYLTATSQFAPVSLGSPDLAQYGIFAGNSRGPGLITHSYASNMVLRQPDELRPGHPDPVLLHAAELLLPQHRPQRHAHLRARAHRARERGWPALRAAWHRQRRGTGRPDDLQHRDRALPAATQSSEIPQADPHRDAPPAPAAGHAGPLRGRAEKPVLP